MIMERKYRPVHIYMLYQTSLLNGECKKQRISYCVGSGWEGGREGYGGGKVWIVGLLANRPI